MQRKPFYLRPRLLVAAVLGLLVLGLAVVFGPLLLAGPTVVQITPANASQAFNPQSSIRIEFDQWVRADSVAAAVTLDPPAAFSVRSDGKAVLIQPTAELAYGTNYRLTINAGVKNILGRSSAQAQTIAFSTVPYVTVVHVAPTAATHDIALNTPITVEFDRPVVSADSIAAAAEQPALADSLPQPLALTPETPGVGRWLSPTMFGFYPEPRLQAGTDYSVMVRSDISGDGSVRLKQPTVWAFTTSAVVLREARPFDGATEVPAQAPIEVRLAEDVDVQSASAHFVLQSVAGGAPITGKVEAFDGGFRFMPAVALERGVSYEAQLQPGITTVAGTAINAQPLTWRFDVIGDLAVEQVEPLPDAVEVLTTTRRISVRFNHPVVALTTIDAQATLPQPLSITPALPGTGRWIDTRTYVYSPTSSIQPATTYRVSIQPGLQDQTGGTLKDAYTWSFTSIRPAVLGGLPASGEQDVAPTAAISITFNQPMQLESLRSALALQDVTSGAAVAGTLTINDAVAIFQPSAPLERGHDYQLTIQPSARAAASPDTLSSPYLLAFRAAPLPALVSSSPAAGVTTRYGGSVELEFSTAMDWASVERNLKIEPAPSEVYTYTYSTNFSLSFDAEPETEYRVTIGGDASDPYGVTLGADQVLSYRTAPLDPYLFLLGSRQIAAYNAYVPTQLAVRQVNLASISYALYALDAQQAVRLLNDYEQWNSYAPTAPLAEGTIPVSGTRNQEQLVAVDVGTLDPGIYYVTLGSAGTDAADRRLMVVSPYALTVKRSERELFVWAVDLQSGAPVANLPIQAMSYSQETPQTLGRTDQDGILHVPFDAPNAYEYIALWSTQDGGFSFASTDWRDGISPWDFNLPSQSKLNQLVGSVSTDRPLYRPGHVVNMQGVLRQLENEQYRLPAQSAVHVVVADPEDTKLLDVDLPLSEFGTFSTTLTLDSNAKVGDYRMIASLSAARDDLIVGWFTVAEYRKPAFDVSVTPSAPEVVRGEAIAMDVAAQYFSGGAVANAPVRWRLLSRPFAFTSEFAPGFTFQDLDDPYAYYRWDGSDNSGQELLAEGTASTDAQGHLSLPLPRDLGPVDRSQRLIFSVEITDVDGQVIAGEAVVTVHAGAFYVGLRPNGYVTKVGDEQSVALIALTPADQPLADQALEVKIYQHEWFSVRERGSDGQLYWTSRYTDTLVQTLPATTDAQGRAEVAFTPAAGGSYRIRASAKDAQGHTITSSAFVWVYGGDVFWGMSSSNSIDIIADQSAYQPGDTAKVLVPAPYKGMTALMTIERGAVLEQRVFTIDDTTALLDVPLTADYAPNVYVSITLVKPMTADDPVPDLRFGAVNLPVSMAQQQLTVTVTPDQTEVGPRDKVTYTIKTTDYQGRGVSSAVQLALVDKAVLALADSPNPSLAAAFYSKRPLSTFTASSLTTLSERVTLRYQASIKGGGGGLAQSADLLIRQNMPDTAYWNPLLVTSADGTAQVSVTLPDNLTTWRMTASAITKDTKVGSGTSEIVAARPLLIRPTLPRFLTVGDQAVLQAVVQNTTSQAIAANVKLDAGTLKLNTPAQQQISVPANDRTVVRWTVDVPQAGSTTLLFVVSGAGLQDAVEQTLPVQRFTTPEVVATAGQVLGQPVVETLMLPTAAQVGGAAQGEATLELVPSLAAGIQSSLDYLTAYPYDCTEQTVSRFLPNIVTYRLFNQLGLEDAELKAQLDQNLSAGLQRLYATQQLDGGWGWWANDKSAPYLTAYVVQALHEAQRAGYGVDASVLDKALQYLQSALNGAELDGAVASWRANARAYVLFVLAEVGQPDRGRTVKLYEQRTQLNIYGRAYLLMTLQQLGQNDERVKTLTADLMSSALLSPTTAHWEDASVDSWTMSSTARTTALALQALVRVDPNNFLIPNAVRYLMSLRESGHWRTTQESALTLMALSEYLAQSGELKADYTYRAALDGAELSAGQVNRTNLDEPISVVFDLAKVKLDGSQLTLERQSNNATGAGRLYYTLRMRYYQDAAAVQPLDQGLIIQREYSAVDSATLSPTGQLITQANLGDVVQVRLTLQVPEDVQYLMVEDMLPAGLEALDTSLKTVTSAAAAPEFASADQRPYWWYFNRTSIHDNRVALFATELPRGTYTYTYLARAATPGTFQTLPAVAAEMYQPEVFGRSAGTLFAVREP